MGAGGPDVTKGKPPFEEIVKRHQQAVWAFLFGSVGDEEKARDLTQETFLQACRGYGRFRGDSDSFTWLYAIARNLLRKEWRRERVRRLFLTSHAGKSHFVDPADDTIEERIRLRSALAKIAEPFRETLLLYYFADRSVRQIANDLDVAEGTVKSRLARGRETLRNILERE